MPQPQNPQLIALEDIGFEAMMAELILQTYPIREDDSRLRASVVDFEKQRGDYPVRREFGAYQVVCSEKNRASIEAFGFNIK